MIIDISKPQIGNPNIQIWTPDNVKWDLLTLKNDILSSIHETYSLETHYESIPGELTESDRSYITVKAKKLIAYIYKGQICNSCKYFAIAHVGLDFHHVNPKDKLSSIHEITRNNGERGINSLWGFLCELDKTIPLCKICHSSFHSSLRKPKKENCIVQKDKIVEYILNENHDIGKSKARFFKSFGFSTASFEVLQAAFI